MFIYSIVLSVQNSNDAFVNLFVSLLLASPVVYWIFSFYYTRRYNHLWEEGIFPYQLKFDRDALLEAYICLAARMIQSNTEDAGEKIQFMSNYFQRHFPNSNYNFGESLTYSYRHPIQIKTVAAWINKNISQKKQRIQVLYFMAGLSMVDGTINARELRLLDSTCTLLDLSPGDLNSILAMYYSRNEDDSNKSSKINSANAIRLSFQILGISEHASMHEIKKEYRSLVKRHHPDRFVNESDEQQKIAMDRFIQIQKAYEILEKYKF